MTVNYECILWLYVRFMALLQSHDAIVQVVFTICLTHLPYVDDMKHAPSPPRPLSNLVDVGYCIIKALLSFFLIFFVRLKIIEICGVYGCLQILIKNDSKSFWDPVNRGWTCLDRSTNIFNAWHIEELKLMTNVDFRGIWIIYKPYAKICKISQLCMLDDQSQYCTSETIHNHESISGENGPKHHMQSADVGTVSAP